MPKSILLLFVFVPLIGISQSARKTNKLLQAEYTSLLKTYDSLYKADGMLFSNGKQEYKNIGVIINPIGEMLKEIGTMKRQTSDLSGDLRLLEISHSSDTALGNVYKAVDANLEHILGKVSAASKEHVMDKKVDFPLAFPGKGSVKKQNQWLTESITEVREKNKSLQTLNMRLRLIFATFEWSNSALTQANTTLDSLKFAFDEKLKSLTAQKLQAKENFIKNGPKGFNPHYFYQFPDAFPATISDSKTIDATADNFGTWDVPVEAIPEPIYVQEPVIYTVVDEYPEFPGGMAKLKEFMKANLRYPETALELGIEGKCYLQFVVSAQGNISNVKVLRGVPDCPECDKEAIRMTKSMPKWTPGKINGKAVNSWFNLPVAFKLP